MLLRNDLIETIFVIDASGSMYNAKADTIGGFNSLIESQKKQSGETLVTSIFFNNEVKVLDNCVSVQQVQPLTNDNYIVGGSTALYDAVGYAIDSVGERLAATPEENRPAEVMVVIVTDGFENSSKEYCFEDIKERIERQQKIYSWKFVFLGEDIKAVQHAQDMGISRGLTHTYSKKNIDTVYASVDTMMRDSKMGNIRGTGYTVQQAANTLERTVK